MTARSVAPRPRCARRLSKTSLRWTTLRRLREITGDTDSELFFAYLLTLIDERGLVRLADENARLEAHELIAELTAELRAARIGAFNFLLSDGHPTFAHRFGRSLVALERTPADPVRERRDLGHGAAITTWWVLRRQAVFIASERITDEPRREVDDGTLLRIERSPAPRIVTPSDGDRAQARHRAPRSARVRFQARSRF